MWGVLGVGCKLSACQNCCLLEAKEPLQTRCLGNSSPSVTLPGGRTDPDPLLTGAHRVRCLLKAVRAVCPRHSPQCLSL